MGVYLCTAHSGTPCSCDTMSGTSSNSNIYKYTHTVVEVAFFELKMKVRLLSRLYIY